MSLKESLKQRNSERLEMERREKEQNEAEWKTAGFEDILDVQPHPLRWRSSEMIDDYVLGQLIIREEIPPLEDGGKLLFLFAKSLNLSKERLEELSQTAALYDDQAKSEHLEKLALYLRNDEVVCFLYDIARLHGIDYNFEGEISELVQNLVANLFRLDRIIAENVLFLCASISRDWSWHNKKHYDAIIAFCQDFPNIVTPSDYLVIDLSAGKDAKEYPLCYTNIIPDNNQSICRESELWLRRIPAGTFTMGSPRSEPDRWSEELQHSVTLTEDFYIGVFPVTQRQWELVMGNNPSFFTNQNPLCVNLICSSAPVERVSYDDICGSERKWPLNSAVASDSFLGRLRSKTKQEGFDLPTEGQWEYACRAGTVTALNNGMDLTSSEGSCWNLSLVGWYDKNSEGRTHYVGQKRPNAWGLYDMHGNVWEWCRDCYDDYPPNSVMNPRGAKPSKCHVCRGGSWNSHAKYCRAANRIMEGNGAIGTKGFRLVFVPVQ
ncbi:MAG: formylglycine-generating enzyme family protein [Lentisphaeria bacterium]|nr:formylglycine-generating enzyme family protein [Lentisphaeria bacterium]